MLVRIAGRQTARPTRRSRAIARRGSAIAASAAAMATMGAVAGVLWLASAVGYGAVVGGLAMAGMILSVLTAWSLVKT